MKKHLSYLLNDKEVLNNLSFARNLRIDLIEDLPQTQIKNKIDFVTY